MGSHLDAIAPIVLAVAGNALLPGLGTGVGAALGGGLGSAGVNYSQNHSLGRALESGALAGGGTYLGSNIANNLLGVTAANPGGQLGTVGSLFGSPASTTAASSDLSLLPGALAPAYNSGVMNAADEFGSNAFNGANAGMGALPWSSGAASSGIGSAAGSMASAALNQPISGIVGGYAGNTLASGFQPAAANSLRGEYVPSMASTTSMPASLNSMASLTPNQQASSLATQGAYGGGLGPQEQGYFANLINNQIVGGGSPNTVENSYLSNLGFGNEGSNYNLAKALSQWNPSA